MYKNHYHTCLRKLVLAIKILRGLNKYQPIPNIKRIEIDHTALWSYPFSGNTWVRFIVEYLTGCPSCGANTKNHDASICLRIKPMLALTHVDMSKPFVIYKQHHTYPLNKNSSLILLIRDYSKCMSKVFMGFKYYLDLIVAYDRFEGKKMLIYYEDLLAEPQVEIYKLKQFFNAPEKRYKTFMKRYQWYQSISQKSRGSRAKGKLYEKANSPQSIEYMNKQFAQLLNKPEYQCAKPYLARYMNKATPPGYPSTGEELTNAEPPQPSRQAEPDTPPQEGNGRSLQCYEIINQTADTCDFNFNGATYRHWTQSD